jgi:histone H3/H4
MHDLVTLSDNEKRENSIFIIYSNNDILKTTLDIQVNSQFTQTTIPRQKNNPSSSLLSPINNMSTTSTILNPVAPAFTRHAKATINVAPRPMTQNAILRLARKAGCKRVSKSIVEEIQIREYLLLRCIVSHCLAIAECGRVKTITLDHVKHAYSRLGRTLYM